MPDATSVFIFSDAYQPTEPGSVVARVPEGISDRETLFDALSEELGMPPYFGRNWDALSECLRDLSWLPSREVAVVHRDILDLGTDGTRMYVEVLYEAARSWTEDDERSLNVVFPSHCEEAVLRMLGQRAG